MGKRVETDVLEHQISLSNSELNSKYFYPFAGKDFNLSDDAFNEAMKLPREQRFLIINIVEEIDNIFKFKYNLDLSKFHGKIPETFDKHGVFVLHVGSLKLNCYIDIIGSTNECLIFGIEHLKTIEIHC